MTEWIGLIGPLAQAGIAIAEAIASASRGEDPPPRIEAARAAIARIPVRTGAAGTWTADTASRLRGPASTVATAESVRVRAAIAAHLPAIDVARLDLIVGDIIGARSTVPPSPSEPDSEDGA